ncbi:hypothetical protein ACFSQ7_31035 [Paenibacillus rhizoplanae]
MKKGRRLDTGMLLAVITALGLHGVIENYRIQMAPAYAAALGLLIILSFRLLKQDSRDRPKRSTKLWKSLLLIVILLLAGVSVYASRLLPMFTLPEPTGHYAIGTIARELTDENRDETLSPQEGDKRKLMINVWYPVAPELAEGKPKRPLSFRFRGSGEPCIRIAEAVVQSCHRYPYPCRRWSTAVC